MEAWIDAFVPTFGLIALGFGLRAVLLRDEAVWNGFETLTYWVLLPTLLAYAISTVNLADLPLGGMAVVIWVTLGLATVVALILARRLGHAHAATTSILQGGIRFNNYIAFALASGLKGAPGLALAGVAAGLIVPFVQLILTFAFVLGGGRRVSSLGLLRQIVLNPLLLGCFVGFVFAGLGGMPPGIGPLARSLGQASLAIGLLCVGAALRPGDLKDEPVTQVAVALLKLVAVPALALLLARLVGLEPVSTTVVVLTLATPTATSSYVMARAMGGDARLMAVAITLQHLAAIFTLPVWAAIVG